MNLSISIKNFNENKDIILSLVFLYFIVSITGALYIYSVSSWLQTTYYINIQVQRYLIVVFYIFYPIITISFLLSHIKIIRSEENENQLKGVEDYDRLTGQNIKVKV